MHDYISGIQQIGIGVQNATEALHRYKQLFGMDTLVFDDTSEASLMTRYTGGKVYLRQALLSLNMQGGGGFEIWQYKNRQPAKPTTPISMGDLGIYAAKLKATNVRDAHDRFSNLSGIKVSSIMEDVKGAPCFWVTDNDGNTFQVVSCNHWFRQNGTLIGGVCGAVIGVSDIEQAIPFYATLLNLEQVSNDVTGTVPGTNERIRSVLLQKKPCSKGAFSQLLGPVEIELIQSLDRQPKKIYEQRFWGDCGFIHLCFDVFNMPALKQRTEAMGYPFTVDSQESFGMESASGRFCYVEDPDGTLIELVETHKVPVFKKWGIHLNLQKRLEKPLPKWMIQLLALSKVK